MIAKRNIRQAQHWFEVLQTSERTQTAMMTLAPASASGSEPEGHAKSDQTLLVVEGTLEGEIGEETFSLTRGDVIIIPAGTKHRFVNRGSAPAVTFNTYSPPEYPAGEKN